MIDEGAGRHQDRRSPGGRQVGDRLVPIGWFVVPELEKRRQTNQFFVVERRAAVVTGPFAIGRLSGIALRFAAQGFRRNEKDGLEDDLAVFMLTDQNDETGRESCRESVCQDVLITVGAGTLQKKK